MNSPIITLNLQKPGERLDKAIAEALPELSRSQCQRLIKLGNVKVDGKRGKPSLRLGPEAKIQVIIPEPEVTDILPEDIPIDIRYEDNDLLLVNKESGMVVHPAPGHSSGTLVNAVLSHCPDLSGIGGELRPGIVHRLDKDTSGLIIIAKNEFALRKLQEQFKSRSVKKRYLALVEGQLSAENIVIDAPIGRSKKDRKRMSVLPSGSSAKSRPAVTEVLLIKAFDNFSLLECRPITGRTHQIRVHLTYSAHPIVGDTIYGRRKTELKINRLFLHAAGIEFHLPSSGRSVEFRVDLPLELQTVLTNLSSQQLKKANSNN